MKPDLHCHSHFSDGQHAPEFLIQRAIENGVTHLAITDHDCIAAFQQLDDSPSDIRLISGVEISCDWNGLEIHVVGLMFDCKDVGLLDLLALQQQRRRDRISAIAEKLEALGHPGLLDYFENLPCISYTRSHVADYLVQQGICKNRQKAFNNFLAKRGRAFVPSSWCSLSICIGAIRQAGGIAVLAHPSRYPLTKSKLATLVDDFAAAGGEAIEVSYSNIAPVVKQALSELSLAKQLYASVGSDFHDAAAHWTNIGKFPPLNQDTQKNAIWLHPKWHS